MTFIILIMMLISMCDIFTEYKYGFYSCLFTLLFHSFIEVVEDTPFRGVLGASQTFIIGT